MRGGFTILEMLIVMVLVSIVITIAMPTLRGPLRAQRMETVVQSLIGDLRLARTEAIRRNTTGFVGKGSASQYSIGYYPLGGGTPVVVFSRTLGEDATFGTGTPDTLKFSSFGGTTTMVTYVLQMDGMTRNVRITAGGNAIAE